jgi:hypothetical protein
VRLFEIKATPPLPSASKQPPSLSLHFSNAASQKQIEILFTPAIKRVIDPNHYVVKREGLAFEDAIKNGRAATLRDPQSGEVFALSMAYPVFSKHSKNHDFTEIGTSQTRLGGFRCAQIVIAALSLKEWLNNRPRDSIVTEILPDNGASLHAYKNALGWQAIEDKDKTKRLHILCNETISAEDKGRHTIWFEAAPPTLKTMAALLLRYMDNGYLQNRKTGESIRLDLSALATVGLTRTVLEQIATNQRAKPPTPQHK